jgi:hypothetical protein
MENDMPTMTQTPDEIADLLGDGLADALGDVRAARWRLVRDPYEPTAIAVRAEGEPMAAVLTRSRPATAATKIVDLWWADAESGAAALDAVITRARARRDAVVKWELPDGATLPDFGVERGFVPMRAPWSAVGTESMQGFALWLEPVPHEELGYYAQTTLFTCGAVAALMATAPRGAAGFAGDADDRDLEVGFWRRASNYPACEPVGLAVATREHIPGVRIEVALDKDGPVLLEGYEGFARDFRAELQQDSLDQANALGIPIRRDRVTMDELASRIAAGESALLLIDEVHMHHATGPHWITAHASDGADLLIVDDPWCDHASGESWVDAHDLPVRTADIDRMLAWGDTGYRGVIFLG